VSIREIEIAAKKGMDNFLCVVRPHRNKTFQQKIKLPGRALY